jgi:hypothetical protein
MFQKLNQEKTVTLIYEIAMTPFVANTNKDLAIPYLQNLNIIYI